MRSRVLIVCVGMLLTVTAAAAAATLGGTPQASPASATATPAAKAAAAALIDPRTGGFEVALGEWQIAFEAKAIRPGPVTFVVRNKGKHRHALEFKLRRISGGVGDDAHHGHGDDDGDEIETDELRPGQTQRITVNLAPGVYEFECPVGDHDDKGMSGRFEVRADAPFVAPRPKSGNVVAIKSFSYRPQPLTVKRGTTVRWRNEDAAPHTVTATSGAWTSKSLRRGDLFSRRFTKAGTYRYLCALHPTMRAKVVVK